MAIDRGEMLVEIGMQRVVIDKLFGPHIFANLRITPDLERGWIIERQCGSSGDWVEWVTIPEQLESDFVEGSVRDGG